MNYFKNKTIIVTGGSRGIGKTICLEFAKLGANIIFNYVRNHEEAKNTKQEITQYNVDCDYIKCNYECKQIGGLNYHKKTHQKTHI